MYHIIVALDHPEMALGVEGRTLLFTTEYEAREFCAGFVPFPEQYGVIEAPADVTGMVVA